MNQPIIGIAQRRIDGRLKVSGAARYAAEHPQPGMLYAYGVYSTIAHGRICNIDDRQAAAMPGWWKPRKTFMDASRQTFSSGMLLGPGGWSVRTRIRHDTCILSVSECAAWQVVHPSDHPSGLPAIRSPSRPAS